MNKAGLVRHIGRGVGGAIIAVSSLALPGAAAFAGIHHAPSRKGPVAHLKTVRGIVIADEPARHAIVVTTPRGMVSTLRTTLSNLPVGTVVISRASILADGTFHSRSLHRAGHSTRTRIRATVVGTNHHRLLLSAGGSVFSIGTTKATGVARFAHTLATLSSAAPVVGEVVDATVAIAHNTIDQTGIVPIGQSSLIGLQGSLSAISPTSITVAVTDGALTTVEIPSSLSLPTTIAVGDQVEVLSSYANSAFTLVTIKDDSLAALQSSVGVSQGGDGESQDITASGTISALSTSSITVQPGGQSTPVTFVIPAGFNLAGITTGETVSASGSVVSGVLTLTKVDVPETGGESSTTTIKGSVVSFSSTELTIAPSDGSAQITLSVPAGFDLSQVFVGAQVNARVTSATTSGSSTTAAPVLVKLEVQDAGNVETKGTVTSVSTTSLVVTPDAGSTGSSSVAPAPITFAIPAGFVMTDVIVGVEVHVHGTPVSGVLTLTKAEVPDSAMVHANGVVSTVSTTELGITPSDGSSAVTFAIPAGFVMTGIVAGAHVDARGELANGSPVLISAQVSTGN